MMSKATRRYTPEKLTRSELADLADKLKRRSATEIFKRLGVRHYTLRGTTYKTPGFAALEGLPKKAPIRVVNPDHWYSGEELVDLYKQWASATELERITR